MPETTIDDTDFQLGEAVTDELTEMTGTVTAIAKHITGCTRVAVQSPDPQRAGDDTFLYEGQLSSDGSVSADGDWATSTDIGLGQRVKHDITGFEGVVVTVTFQMYNCPRIGVQSTDDPDHKEFFDAPQVSAIGDGVRDEYMDSIESEESATTGAVGADLERASSR